MASAIIALATTKKGLEMVSEAVRIAKSRAIPVGTLILTNMGQMVTVVDQSDSALVGCESLQGTRFKIGRANVRHHSIDLPWLPK